MTGLSPHHPSLSASSQRGEEVELSRMVRVCIDDDAIHNAGGRGLELGTGANTFAGAPCMLGLGRFYWFRVRCTGPVDPVTGYSLNIKVIDDVVRSHAVPVLIRALKRTPMGPASELMPEIFAATVAGFRETGFDCRWLAVSLGLTPTYCLECASPPQEVPVSVLIRQHFDFAAAHRLNAPTLSAEENQRLFGKCNNPRGHGHNYRVEPCVEVPLSTDGLTTFSLADLESATARTIIDRFDHKHLNEDTVEFNTSRGGVNPSVENIARVCFDLLSPAVAAGGTGATLRSVTVWETEKTSATYPA